MQGSSRRENWSILILTASSIRLRGQKRPRMSFFNHFCKIKKIWSKPRLKLSTYDFFPKMYFPKHVICPTNRRIVLRYFPNAICPTNRTHVFSFLFLFLFETIHLQKPIRKTHNRCLAEMSWKFQELYCIFQDISHRYWNLELASNQYFKSFPRLKKVHVESEFEVEKL